MIEFSKLPFRTLLDISLLSNTESSLAKILLEIYVNRILYIEI
jgi:hypothetical protein